MQNLRPSNIKVIFQRPSCGSPIAVASGFIAVLPLCSAAKHSTIRNIAERHYIYQHSQNNNLIVTHRSEEAKKTGSDKCAVTERSTVGVNWTHLQADTALTQPSR